MTAPFSPATGVSEGAPEARLSAARILREVRRQKVVLVSLIWLFIVLLVAGFGAWLTPYDPLEQNLTAVLQSPSGLHLLGTDALGRDILSRLVVGTQTSLLSSMEAVAIAIFVGTPLGLVAGYFGSWLDSAVSRVSEALLALPAIIILITILAVFGNNLWIGMAGYGVILAAGIVRIVRAGTLSIRNELFIDAAKVNGVRSGRIIVRHVFPHIVSTLIVQSSLMIGFALLTGAGLTFLGLGPAPPAATWGGMVSEAQAHIFEQPWLLVPVGAVLSLTLLSFNTFGDFVHDIGSPDGKTRPRKTRRELAARRASVEERAPRHVTAAHDDALLSVRDLWVTIKSEEGDIPVLLGVSFALGRGKTLALVGESGSGKTMSAMAVLGLLPPGGEIVGGAVYFDGHQISNAPERELVALRGSRIGLVSQEPMVALDPTFTVGNQLAEPIRRHTGRRNRAEIRQRAMDLLTQVGIPNPDVVYRSYPHQLSGGMAQRVAIARALAGDPDLLIADEPSTALDVTIQAELLDLLRKLQQDRHMALLLVTHNFGVVADICERVAVMQRGEIVEEGTVESVFAHPSHPYTQMLMASILDGAPARGALVPDSGGSTHD